MNAREQAEVDRLIRLHFERSNGRTAAQEAETRPAVVPQSAYQVRPGNPFLIGVTAV